jgi:glyoxylase-like metal-dependent hydrolase (beta-lactamase superfamily II)
VHTVFVTHSHPDHFGGAARFAREAGAEIVAHHGFAFGEVRAVEPPAEVSVEDLAAERADAREGEDTTESMEDTEKAAGASASAPRWGGSAPWGGRGPRPPLRHRLRWRLMHLLQRSGRLVPRISQPVQQGDILELCGREWFVMHTPGHTADHVCLHDPERGIFLAGDHVLPSITPHISGLSSSRDPLRSFFYSLDRVAEIHDVRLALPAHGHPFTDLAGRAEAIKRHHHERLERLKAIGREIGPAGVRAFSTRLFEPRSWGAMAESETYAHLEHLHLSGEAERYERRGELIYECG